MVMRFRLSVCLKLTSRTRNLSVWRIRFAPNLRFPLSQRFIHQKNLWRLSMKKIMEHRRRPLHVSKPGSAAFFVLSSKKVQISLVCFAFCLHLLKSVSIENSLHRVNILQKFIGEKEAKIFAPISCGPLAFIKPRLTSVMFVSSKTVGRPTSIQLRTRYEHFVHKIRVIPADCTLSQMAIMNSLFIPGGLLRLQSL